MTARRLARIALSIVGVIVGLFVLVGFGIIAKGEWNARTAQDHRIPAFAAGPAGTESSATSVLILLHGAGLNGRMWDPVRRHLDPQFRIIAPDLPGHGARAGEVFALDAAVATVAAAARSVAPAPVVLVGDSLGGYVAMASASAIPREQLRGLVVGGCTADLGRPEMLRYLRDVVIINITAALTNPTMLATKILNKIGVAETDAQAIVAAGVNLRAVPAAVRALLYVDFRGILAAIDQPVLIVNGALDSNAVAHEPDYLAVAKHGTSYRFADTEHGVSLRRSAELAGVVNKFVAAVTAPQAATTP